MIRQLTPNKLGFNDQNSRPHDDAMAELFTNDVDLACALIIDVLYNGKPDEIETDLEVIKRQIDLAVRKIKDVHCAS